MNEWRNVSPPSSHHYVCVCGGGRIEKLKCAGEEGGALVLDFYIATAGSLQEGELSSGPLRCCLMGLLVLARRWRVLFLL